MKILIVDDSLTMRKIIIKNLSSRGFDNVVEAENGADALNKLEGVSLILTDWNMPVMDGLTFVKEVRKTDGCDKIPIIMVTTEGAKSEVVEALKAGVTDYIVKPFKPELIIEKVRALNQKMNK